jgi:acetyl-CoA carboxylase beta subunit
MTSEETARLEAARDQLHQAALGYASALTEPTAAGVELAWEALSQAALSYMLARLKIRREGM